MAQAPSKHILSPARTPSHARSTSPGRILPPSPGFSTIRFEKRGAVAWITLNRPRQLNAYNMAMRDDLFAALSAIHDDPEVRAMVLTGAGPAFSTGGDVSEFGSAPSPTVARWVRFRRDVWGRLRALPVPTIAAVHGYAVGGGLEMVLLCDVAVAADDARFCLPETGLGMIPGVAGTQTAARRLGPGWALDLCLTGRWIDAKEALFIGLVAEVVPRAALMRAAGAMARRLSRIPRERAAIAKLAVWDGLDLPLGDALAMERRLARRLDKLSAMGNSARRRAEGRRPGGNGAP
jgi:enoyl-CoA hydratase